MHIRNLGPHTFLTPQTHERRHDWLKRFKPQERRALIEEDYRARTHVFALLIGVMLAGLVLLLAAVLAAT
jgi:hypothetical protein